jgi:hypothetical protein
MTQALRIIEESTRAKIDQVLYINNKGQMVNWIDVSDIVREIKNTLKAADELYDTLSGIPYEVREDFPDFEKFPLFGAALRDLYNLVSNHLDPDTISTCNFVKRRKDPNSKPELYRLGPVMVVGDRPAKPPQRAE